MKKFRMMTIVGTRPEVIRLCRIIPQLDLVTEHCFVHTGQNYDFELNDIFFEDLKLRRPDHVLKVAGDSAAQTIGNVISQTDLLMEKVNPEALLVLGDTNSCLAAISAKRRKIPIFHMEAGNRCFDMRVPEEINRKIVDHVADINLAYSDIAREYLLREGIPQDRIIKTGSPMKEVLDHYESAIDNSKILNKLNLTTGCYFVVSIHREENLENEKNLKELIKAVNMIAQKYDQQIIFTVHPRTRKRLEKEKIYTHPNVQLHKPFGFTSYINLQKNARVVLSDSGTITEEASLLGFPALNIREAHERPEGMEEASVMMTGLRSRRILQALSILESEKKARSRPTKVASDYLNENVSTKVPRIIFSYTDYVQRTIWQNPVSSEFID